MSAETIDVAHLAQSLVAAKAQADALPYKVTFQVDEERGLFIMRADQEGDMRSHSATTGDRLAALLLSPEEGFDRMFGFLAACMRG